MRLFVVGMHRSGTSVLVRLLERLGFSAGHEGDFHAPTDHDPEGHREHVLFWRANEAALAALGRAWDDPWPLDWSRLPADARPVLEARCAAAVLALDRHAPWVAKDPRFCLTLPLWRRVVSPVCLHVLRDPLEVARSLAARGGMPVFWGIALWEAYQRAALQGSAGLPRIFVRYGDLAADPTGFATHLAGRLRAMSPGLELATPAAAAASFDPRRLRQKASGGEVAAHLNPAQQRLWSALDRMGDDLDEVAAELVSEPAREILAVYAEQRERLAALERRDLEISRWNEELWSKLEAARRAASRVESAP
jgi:hypothetical protein